MEKLLKWVKWYFSECKSISLYDRDQCNRNWFWNLDNEKCKIGLLRMSAYPTVREKMSDLTWTIIDDCLLKRRETSLGKTLQMEVLQLECKLKSEWKQE